jgi:hypothetical protein
MLPEYERTCLKEYTFGDPKQIFNNNESEELKRLLDRLKEFFSRNEFETLFDSVKQEAKEIQVWIDLYLGLQWSHHSEKFLRVNETAADIKIKVAEFRDVGSDCWEIHFQDPVLFEGGTDCKIVDKNRYRNEFNKGKVNKEIE